MARSVADIAILLNIMAGPDPRDPHAIEVEAPDYTDALSGDIKGMRVAVPTNYFFSDVQPVVGDAVTAAIRRFEQLGATIVPMMIPIMTELSTRG